MTDQDDIKRSRVRIMQRKGTGDIAGLVIRCYLCMREFFPSTGAQVRCPRCQSL